ncbi:hypothetical protein B296_00002498 [Ensete ventricosum]|uniref:Uncharacterized protein n=1 Tax=Ensete ventricosum TaxID=4639 RepID=A0A426YEU6_ENSVE|nr:hypothetical protein B296_00002498 [Ensete ventricosum]
MLGQSQVRASGQGSDDGVGTHLAEDIGSLQGVRRELAEGIRGYPRVHRKLIEGIKSLWEFVRSLLKVAVLPHRSEMLISFSYYWVNDMKQLSGLMAERGGGSRVDGCGLGLNGCYWGYDLGLL